MIIVRTPLRVSFFGGGTDHPAWFNTFGPGAVLSTSIYKYVYITIRRLPDIFDFKYRVVWRMVEQCSTIDEITHPVVREVLRAYCDDPDASYEIVYHADLPARSGLGSSSAFTVAALHALMHGQRRRVDKHALAAAAIHVEQVLLREPVGSQDPVAAAFGGLNEITFSPGGGIRVDPIDISPRRKQALNSHLMMFFTGFTRDAGAVESDKMANFARRIPEMTAIHAMVAEGRAILENPFRPIEDFGGLLDEAWRRKRRLAASVSNPSIDALYDAALEGGALGGKLLGAGGGGFLLFFVPPERQDGVREAVRRCNPQNTRPPAFVSVKAEDVGSAVVLSGSEPLLESFGPSWEDRPFPGSFRSDRLQGLALGAEALSFSPIGGTKVERFSEVESPEIAAAAPLRAQAG